MLVDAYRLEKLQGDPKLIHQLLDASVRGLDRFVRRGELQSPAEYRLAFRELGLSLGLHAAARMEQGGSLALALQRYHTLADEIESFWLDPKHQATKVFQEHLDINEVMLATSLDPDGFLGEWSLQLYP